MIYTPQRITRVALAPNAKSIPLIGRGGEYGVTVQTKTPVQANQGQRLRAGAAVKNTGGQSGRFRIECTLGKFAPGDYASGGPLYIGQPMQFYARANQGLPGPNNLAFYEATTNARKYERAIAPGETVDILFVSAELVPIIAYTGQKVNLLDVHWTCEVEVSPGQWEWDWTVADINVVQIAEVIPARGQIIRTSYSVV